MYLVVIAWLYVVLMAAVAEAVSSTGTVLGAVITFLLYGLLPLGIVVYIIGTPGRKRALRARAVAERAEAAVETEMQHPPHSHAVDSALRTPDTNGKPSAATQPDTIPPVGKEV